MKKIIGYSLILLAFFFIFILVLLIQDEIVINAISNIPNLFNNSLGTPEHYRIIGNLSGLFVQIIIIILLFVLGKKLIKT